MGNIYAQIYTSFIIFNYIYPKQSSLIESLSGRFEDKASYTITHIKCIYLALCIRYCGTFHVSYR